jgi:hypothetical protein
MKTRKLTNELKDVFSEDTISNFEKLSIVGGDGGGTDDVNIGCGEDRLCRADCYTNCCMHADCVVQCC